MTLPELSAAVLTKTRRPDLQKQALLGIQEATHWAHTYDFFKRDLSEISFDFTRSDGPGPLSKGTYPVKDTLPLFRKLAFIRRYDPVSGLPIISGPNNGYFKQAEPDALIDSRYARAKTDILYLAGSNINWYACTEDRGHIVGYYKLPSLSMETYNSWIADQYPFAIILYAASCVFRDIDQPDVAKANRAEAIEKIEEVRTADIETLAR